MDTRDLGAAGTAVEFGLPPSPQKQTLQNALAAIAADDFDRLAQHFTEDCHLTILGFPDIAGHWMGREAVVHAARDNFRKIIHQAPLITAIVEQGNVIAFVLEETGQIQATSESYHVRGSIWYTFRDTQICRVDEFLCLV